mmetsp:Transcript_155/g.469  ORF Transcript_155/g.469 Transcript_155/m.469 type:complete len:375 (+) Transcript_155:1335-2459(+)
MYDSPHLILILLRETVEARERVLRARDELPHNLRVGLLVPTALEVRHESVARLCKPLELEKQQRPIPTIRAPHLFVVSGGCTHRVLVLREEQRLRESVVVPINLFEVGEHARQESRGALRAIAPELVSIDLHARIFTKPLRQKLFDVLHKHNLTVFEAVDEKLDALESGAQVKARGEMNVQEFKSDSPRHLLVDEREGERNARPPLQYFIHERVARVVKTVFVPHKPERVVHVRVDRLDRLERIARPCLEIRELRRQRPLKLLPERVQHLHGCVDVDLRVVALSDAQRTPHKINIRLLLLVQLLDETFQSPSLGDRSGNIVCCCTHNVSGSTSANTSASTPNSPLSTHFGASAALHREGRCSAASHRKTTCEGG